MNAATDGRYCGIYRCGNRRLEIGKKTLIMGILNVTPDSFSDGGRFNSVDAAVDRCALMIREGADCIDLGAEATGPNAVPVSSEEELARLIPVLEAVRSRFDIPLSVDTFKSQTAKEAITAGCDIINDITGFMGDPEMARVVADNGTGAILMFNKRTNGENPIAFEPISRRAVKELTESRHSGRHDHDRSGNRIRHQQSRRCRTYGSYVVHGTSGQISGSLCCIQKTLRKGFRGRRSGN